MANRVAKAKMPTLALGSRFDCGLQGLRTNHARTVAAPTLASKLAATTGWRCDQRGQPRRQQRAFTLIELLLVLAIVAISVGVVSLALRDGASSKLEEEAARLSALLDMARAEARAAGVTVRWVPRAPDQRPSGSPQTSPEDAVQFQFVGLPTSQAMPTRWLDKGTQAQVLLGASNTLVLGPEAILPPQRVLLRLGDRRLVLASDGLSAFEVQAEADPNVPPVVRSTSR
jgi:general secretion pathway protein H